MSPLALSGYDWEYAQLVSLDERSSVHEVQIRVKVPIAGWYYRERLLKIARKLGCLKLWNNTCIAYGIDLTFLGVHDIVDDLLSKGHSVGASELNNATWRIQASQACLSFEIEDIRDISLSDEIRRFYLIAEGLKLEFSYRDCVFLQECSEKVEQ